MNTCSDQNILDMRFRRRSVLCKNLLLLGTSHLLIFGIINTLEQSYVMASLLLSCTFIGYLNLFNLYKTSNIDFAVHSLNGVILILATTLLITETTNILWLYPLLAANVFVNRFWHALFVYLIFFIICIIVLFSPLSEWHTRQYSPEESLTITLTLVSLCTICLAWLYSENKTHATFIKNHTLDLRKLAYFDLLTGLPNRKNLETTLGRLLQRAHRGIWNVGVLYIGLDNFKQIKENYGRKTSDDFQLTFAGLLVSIIRPTDVLVTPNSDDVARLSGGEFVVILSEMRNSSNASLVADKLLTAFSAGIDMNNINHSLRVSIGIAVYPEDAKAVEGLLHHADLAMHEARENGGSKFKFYTKEITEMLQNRRNIEEKLSAALEHNQLVLVYMPIFDCKTLNLVAAEVLIRCDALSTEGIGPEQFIPIAEKSKLIKDIDLWVIDNSMAALAELQLNYDFSGKFCINISGVELLDETFPDRIKSLLNRHGVSPQTIEFEITETALVLESNKCIAILKQLRDLGLSLALDDFGTGYTAFKQLINYPVNKLKIDRSFVGDLFSEQNARKKMVDVIQNLADLHSLSVVAEGVETKEQLVYLQSIGCDWVQGYFLSKPLSWTEIVALIDSNKQIALELHPISS